MARRTTILADESLLIEARALAERQGVTFTALVQEALRDYLHAHRRPSRVSFAGSGRSGNPQLARSDEQVLAQEIEAREGWSPRRDGRATHG
jgi:hypothetical protein